MESIEGLLSNQTGMQQHEGIFIYKVFEHLQNGLCKVSSVAGPTVHPNCQCQRAGLCLSRECGAGAPESACC